jgi:hypothetical protein
MASPSRSGGTMHAAITSPFKFLMGSTHSAPDMSVNTLVDRFTTLEVKDRDEESARRTVRRLEAALRRAEMAREEAETEATSLRDDLREQRDMAEERLREKTELRQRLDEYEVCISLLIYITQNTRLIQHAKIEKVRKGQRALQAAKDKTRRPTTQDAKGIHGTRKTTLETATTTTRRSRLGEETTRRFKRLDCLFGNRPYCCSSGC